MSWTPSSAYEATSAYVLPSTANVATPCGPSSSSKPSCPSVALASATDIARRNGFSNLEVRASKRASTYITSALSKKRSR